MNRIRKLLAIFNKLINGCKLLTFVQYNKFKNAYVALTLALRNKIKNWRKVLKKNSKIFKIVLKFILGGLLLIISIYYFEYLILLYGFTHLLLEKLPSDLEFIYKPIILLIPFIFSISLLIHFIGRFTDKVFEIFGLRILMQNFKRNRHYFIRILVLAGVTLGIQLFYITAIPQIANPLLNPGRAAEKIERSLFLGFEFNRLLLNLYLPISAKEAVEKTDLYNKIDAFFTNINIVNLRVQYHITYYDARSNLNEIIHSSKSRYYNSIDLLLSENATQPVSYEISNISTGSLNQWIEFKSRVVGTINEHETSKIVYNDIEPAIFTAFAELMYRTNKIEEANRYYLLAAKSMEKTVGLNIQSSAKLYYIMARNYLMLSKREGSFNDSELGFEYIKKAKSLAGETQTENDINALYMVYLYEMTDFKALFGPKYLYPEGYICKNFERFLLFEKEWDKSNQVTPSLIGLGFDPFKVEFINSRINDSIQGLKKMCEKK